MIYFINNPKQPISLEDIYDHRNIYLLAKSALEKKINCELLLRPRKNQRDIMFLRFAKSKNKKWFGCEQGFFNSKASCDFCLYKYLTNDLLKILKFPLPQSQKIKNIKQLNNLPINPPWVVKPSSGTQGKDVIVKIEKYINLKKTCNKLLLKYPSLIVEKFIPGNDYRLMVLENKFLAAIKRVPPFIKGDGKHSLRELINITNKKREELKKKDTPYLKPIKIDWELKHTLKKQGLFLKSISPENKKIKLRENANFSSGGTVIDVTHKVHPENKKIALKAIHALGLKIGGVDIILKDISRPITKTNGKIIEVNSSPGLWPHHFPNYGKSQPVAKEIINYLFSK